jgi:hypothetical protein
MSGDEDTALNRCAPPPSESETAVRYLGA